ncbi:hypothetical protein KQX54_017706, partial [Cotesia glomerata]
MAPVNELAHKKLLEKKRITERLRYQRIKNDPDLYAQQKVKEHSKYQQKKEKGIIKTVDKMTPQEKRQARKLWREKAKRRRRLLREKLNGSSVPEKKKPDKRIQVAQLKSSRAGRTRNLIIKTQAVDITKLKSR